MSFLNVRIKQVTYAVDNQEDELDLSDLEISAVWATSILNLHTKSLNISRNPLVYLYDIFTLIKLNCSNCSLFYLPGYLPMLEELDCSNNSIMSIPDYPKLKKLTCESNPIRSYPVSVRTNAKNCPITIKHFSPGDTRSGVIKNGKFVWVCRGMCELTDKYILIDWNLAKCEIEFKGKFISKLSKFLFKT